MRVKVPALIQDPQTLDVKALAPLEHLTFDEPFLLDGPVCRRIAVLDLDDVTGELRPGVRLRRATGKSPSTYDIADETRLTAPDFIQVNAFATVRATLKLFEEPDALGREVRWAFDGPQLLIVPQAGEWANAFYERESRSLQFFYFPVSGGQVFTALSQDILAHETAHAVLDGIAPDLYNCLTPQSLALHEAIADLTALLVATRSRKLNSQLLRQTQGSLLGRNALSRMAEQFGFERHRGARHELRSLWNERHLDAADRSLDEDGEPRFAGGVEPHTLSLVLTGALYRVLVRLHEEYTAARAAEKGISKTSASGYGLFRAREHFKRLLLRALDYLPPGEVTFADYGRAILAADQASHPGDSLGRRELVDELVRRHVVTAPEELAVATDYEAAETRDVDLETLAGSDWAAYDFANRHRGFLGIPDGIHFRVRPRLDVCKKYYLGGPESTPVRELLFKVSWDCEEPNPPGHHLPPKRQITVGTTLAIDWRTRRVRALLRSAAAAAPASEDAQVGERDAMLLGMLADGLLLLDPAAGTASAYLAHAELSGDLMRVRASGRMLHLARET